ncbi:MAG: ATP-binding cassette domain-containing protein [Actinomycetota bacterium]
MIELTNATKTYESGGGLVKAVDDVTLTVRDGEFVAVVGHSGSGKTTLVSLMGGLTKPTSGNIFMAAQTSGPWTTSIFPVCAAKRSASASSSRVSSRR